MGKKRAEEKRKCESGTCTNNHYAKGMCKQHYWKDWHSKKEEKSKNPDRKIL
ncbi:hypothetical protein [Paenibacillus phytohabitans]|uniref:hypothetical protein n=1 Tax=Paenibacillus TaxID=44249 RepID=UPI0014913CCB|nr:hypothetical protein [Paenibacillus phytohabitans]